MTAILVIGALLASAAGTPAPATAKCAAKPFSLTKPAAGAEAPKPPAPVKAQATAAKPKPGCKKKPA